MLVVGLPVSFLPDNFSCVKPQALVFGAVVVVVVVVVVAVAVVVVTVVVVVVFFPSICSTKTPGSPKSEISESTVALVKLDQLVFRSVDCNFNWSSRVAMALWEPWWAPWWVPWSAPS